MSLMYLHPIQQFISNIGLIAILYVAKPTQETCLQRYASDVSHNYKDPADNVVPWIKRKHIFQDHTIVHE